MNTEQTPSVTYPTFHPPQNQNPSQPYVIYVPQIVYPQQTDRQPQPVVYQPQQVVCQPQDQSQMQQPLIAQQPYVNIQGDALSDENFPVVHENKLIQEASIQDKHNLAFKATRLLLTTILVSLVLNILSNCNYTLRRFQYNSQSEGFYLQFYFFFVMFISSIIHSFKNFEKARKVFSRYMLGGLFGIFTISFIFMLQSAFPSGLIQYYSQYEYDYFTLMTICALGQAFVTLAGILCYIKSEKKELKFQEATFKIVIPNLVYTIILFAYNLYEVFVIISFITLIVIGFYYIFVLKTFLSKGFKDLKTNEYMIASILIFGKMFVPWSNENN